MPPRRKQPSVEECDAIITTPEAVLEMERKLLNGREVRVWKNCPRTFRDFLLDSERKYAKRPFLSSPTRTSRETVTFQDVFDQALILAARMRSKGMGIGSRIAIGGRNCTGWVVSFIAIHLIGGVAVALNAWLPLEGLLHCLRITQPDLVLLDSDRAYVLGPHRHVLRRDGVGELFTWDEADEDEELSPVVASWATIGEASQAIIERVRSGEGLEQLDPESDAVIFFSSGTSGPPKAVLSTQRMALTNLWSGLVAPSRAALRAGAPIPPLPKVSDPQKTVLLSIPLFHVTGCLSWLLRAFFAGSKMVMMARWDTKAACRLIQEEKVTVIGGVPAVVSAILESPHLPRDRSFETVFYGGAPPSKELAREVKARWPKAGLVQGYGLTETNAYVCSVAGADYIERPATTGPPVPICDIKIVNPTTRQEVPRGSIGLLMVRGPQVMKCYVGDEAATRRAVDLEGWLDTGDIASVDADGFVYIKDRFKDIIIRGGENIVSSDVENALYAHPAVSEAIALGVPDRMLGEKVGAIVVLRPDAAKAVTAADLIDSTRATLPRFAVPAIVLIHDGPLPRNVNGKVVKKDMKPMLWEQWERAGRRDASRIASKL